METPWAHDNSLVCTLGVTGVSHKQNTQKARLLTHQTPTPQDMHFCRHRRSTEDMRAKLAKYFKSLLAFPDFHVPQEDEDLLIKIGCPRRHAIVESP